MTAVIVSCNVQSVVVEVSLQPHQYINCKILVQFSFLSVGQKDAGWLNKT